MTIKDILPQIQPPAHSARPARDAGKAAAHEAEESGKEPKGEAGFEALVRAMEGKADKRERRVAEVRDAEVNKNEDEVREPEPIIAVAAQAMLALDPLFAKAAEAAAAGDSTVASEVKGKASRGKPDEDPQIDVPADGDVATPDLPQKQEKTVDLPAVSKSSDRPAPEITAKPGNGPEAPVAEQQDGPTPQAKTEAAPAQNTAAGETEKPKRTDVPVSPARAGDALRSEPTVPNMQGQATAPTAPSPSAPAAAPVRPAMHLAGVEVISERSQGAAKTLNIRLQPEELGTVTARLRLVPDGIQVDLMADRRDTAERLAADRDLLGKALQSAGFSDNAVVAVTVTERANSATANMGGQQGFTAQDQSGGRNGGQTQAQMQGEGNGNREQRGGWNLDEQARGGAPSSSVEPVQGNLSRGLVV
jgi:hypothetical protein